LPLDPTGKLTFPDRLSYSPQTKIAGAVTDYILIDVAGKVSQLRVGVYACELRCSVQLARFRELKSYCENEARPDEEFDGLIGRNCRPLQPNGTRRVYTPEDPHSEPIGDEDPFRQANFSRQSAFPEPGVIVRESGRA